MIERPRRYVVLLSAAILSGALLLTSCSDSATPSPPPTGGTMADSSPGPSPTSTAPTSAPTVTTPPTSSDPASPSSKPSPTKKPTPTTEPPAEAGAPGVPKVARKHTKAGAEAFARHYIDVINQTGVTPEPGRLEGLSLKSCKTCTNFAGNVLYTAKNKEHQVGPTFRIRSAKIMPDPDTSGLRVRISFTQLPVKVVNQQGKVVRTGNPLQSFFEFRVAWSRGGWKVAKIYAPAS